MYISDEAFTEIKNKYGQWVSWAIWSQQKTANAKCGIGDLSVFDFTQNNNRSLLHVNYVLVGLNASRDVSGDGEGAQDNFANFHSSYKYATDYKIRAALADTPVWGAYMTDVLKDYIELSSGNVDKAIRENSIDYNEHFPILLNEITILGAENATFVAFGKSTEKLLKLALPNAKIVYVPHYANYNSVDAYRDKVLSNLSLD